MTVTPTTISQLTAKTGALTGDENLVVDVDGATVAASGISTGGAYRIETVGTTNWVSIGAATNTIGVIFVATGVGAGTGTATALLTRRVSAQQVADLTTLATAAADGLISAADFTKLASIVVDQASQVVVPVRNTTGATITKGTPVYVPPAGSSGTTILVAPADASTEETSATTIGLVASDIPHNNNGLVVRSGPLSGLNTAHLTEGAQFWLSETTGATTSTKPVAPAHGVALGWCVKQGSGTSGILLVDVNPEPAPTATLGYVHSQETPSNTWTINHNLGYRPSVELLDSGGQEIDAAVSHPSLNQTVVTLSPATAGLARLT